MSPDEWKRGGRAPSLSKRALVALAREVVRSLSHTSGAPLSYHLSGWGGALCSTGATWRRSCADAASRLASLKESRPLPRPPSKPPGSPELRASRPCPPALATMCGYGWQVGHHVAELTASTLTGSARRHQGRALNRQRPRLRRP